MRDPRVDSLARILVRYSVELKEGDTCLIEGGSAGEPLIGAVYEEVLAAGRDLICEKPLAGSSRDGRALVEAADRLGRRIFYAEQLVHVPVDADQGRHRHVVRRQ